MRLIWVPAFFALRVVAALALFKLSALFLPVSDFAAFSQLMTFAALVGVVALCGAETGIIRQTAAAEDAEALRQTYAAAVTLWATASCLVLALVATFGSLASRIVLSSPAQWPIIVAITGVTLIGAPSGIWCALLTGRRQIGQSLTAQATGLALGSAAAAWRITAHDPAGAALAFAGGSLVTGCVALPPAARLGFALIPSWSSWPQSWALLRYSAAIAVTTGYTALLAFGLRWLYREHFGAEPLGYWLAANRISDLSTQLLGLYMIQVLVPHLAMVDGAVERRRFILRSWFIGAGVMSTMLVTFSLASGTLVHLLLSDAFRAAIPIILTYMIGDVLRVWTSLAMHVAFAKGRPASFALIEMATLTLMAGVAGVLTLMGDRAAPQIGYLGAYAFAALIISLVFLVKRRSTTSLNSMKPAAALR